MGREKHNMVSVHVTEADGRSMNIEVYDAGSVAQQLLSVFGRALGAYRDEVKTQVEAASNIQRLMDELGVTDFLGQLARVWGPHPSTVGEPPAEPGYVEWSGSLGDQLREIVAQARAFDVDDDDLRAALEEAIGFDEVPSEECRPVPCPPFVEHQVQLRPDPDRPSDLEQAHAYAAGVDMPIDVAVDRLTDVGPELTLGVDLGGGRVVTTVAQAVPGRPGVYQTVVELPAEDVAADEVLHNEAMFGTPDVPAEATTTYPYVDRFTTE